jgi:hypothetical protein
MARYRKKPVEIEAVEFGFELIPSNIQIKSEKHPNGKSWVFNKLHNSWIEVKRGDMVRIDQAPNDVYPIDRETFEQTYEKIE